VKDTRSKTTATARNAMTDAERDAFLAAPRLSRLSTIRADGFPHVAPCWYLWDGGAFLHSFGPGRMHLQNITRDHKVAECIDMDDRLGHGLDARAAAVVCLGEAQILEDRDENVEYNRRILSRYLPPEDVSRYLSISVAEIDAGRRIVRVHPVRFITWDYDKAA
jgi:nitroimidazol reductase NimA-like FMN-containing flavoprotein (pyridoxamine 5'-phosphate oxidase superfamily)